MTREARLMSGIILITVPTIQYGGIFSADLVDEQEQRVYGEPASTEFLSRWARPRRRDRDSLAHLPDARGRGSAARAALMVCPHRSAALGDPHFGGVFLFGATANCHSSEWCRVSDLCRGTHSRNRRCHSRHWLAAISATCVDGCPAFSCCSHEKRHDGKHYEQQVVG